MGKMNVMVGYGKAEWLKEVFLPPVEITAGDTKVIWDSSKPDEVDAARGMFDKLIAKGYNAFIAEGREGTKGRKITAFEPGAERIMMVPTVMGGANADAQ